MTSNTTDTPMTAEAFSAHMDALGLEWCIVELTDDMSDYTEDAPVWYRIERTVGDGMYMEADGYTATIEDARLAILADTAEGWDDTVTPVRIAHGWEILCGKCGQTYLGDTADEAHDPCPAEPINTFAALAAYLQANGVPAIAGDTGGNCNAVIVALDHDAELMVNDVNGGPLGSIDEEVDAWALWLCPPDADLIDKGDYAIGDHAALLAFLLAEYGNMFDRSIRGTVPVPAPTDKRATVVQHIVRLIADNMAVQFGDGLTVANVHGEFWDGVLDLDLSDGTTVRINFDRPAPTE